MTQTASPPRGLGVTAAAIARLLEDGGCHVIIETEDVVMAERPVLGVPHVLHRIVAQRRAETTFDVAHLVSYRDLESCSVPRHELTELRAGVVDLLDVGRFLDRVLA